MTDIPPPKTDNPLENEVTTLLEQINETSGEKQSALRTELLKLYFDSALTAYISNQKTEQYQLLQRGLEHAQAFLNQGETASSVREAILKLYFNMGKTLGDAPFLDAEQKRATYQRGIEHAQVFLKQGETASSVREVVLALYTALTAVLPETGQQALQIPYFPISGLFSWFSFDKIQEAQDKHTLIKNWRVYLQTAPSPITDFTAAFQAFLHTFLSDWHDPKKSHRHVVSTETLLAISESLYAIAQASENKALNTVFAHLEQLHNSPTVLKTEELQQEKAVLEDTLCDTWQRLTLLPLKDLADLEPLQSLSGWQRLRHWRTLKQLRQARQRYQQIPKHCEAVKTYYHWERGVKRCETALFDWLREAIFKQLDFPNGLDTLPDILLGILLVHSTEPMAPETKIETWLQHPPWQNGESLQRALDGSGWQTWAQGDKPPLYTWLDLLGQKPRLSINQQISYFEQPDLQNGLRQVMAGQPDQLISQLQQAWEKALQRAFLLAQLLTRLDKPNFEGNLLALTENLDFDIGPDSRSLQEVFSALASPKQQAALFQQHDIVDIFEDGLTVVGVTLPTYFKALAAVILGDAPEQIDNALHDWLVKQGEWDDSLPIEETLAVLKHRFNRAIVIYQPKHPKLGNTVHDWAQVLLREVLASETPALEQIWAQLERARIALTGLSLTLPAQWDETLGRALWNSLRTTMDQITGGYVPSENEPWQPIDIWLYQISEWTSNRPPTIETAQQHLPAQEALAQPFLDPVQQRYRVLWLDQNGLSLKDLPDDCALQHLWIDEITGVIGHWTEGLAQWRKRRSTTSDSLRDWEEVMKSVPVQSWANCFQNWAADLTQLTVIFPAPLGQLPWETLPQLEEKLVREISLAHWLKSSPSENRATEDEKQDEKHFVTCDPNGEETCMVKEAAWVAKHYQTRLAAPCPSVFDAIQQLSHCQQAHFCTHGAFQRHNPLASGLTLLSKRDKKDNTLRITFPLWTSSLLPISADVIVLSACESNLSGQETEGLLTPIGIGPALAAAGAKTVIGTLWPCDGVAALCFAYHLYNIADKEPQLPWHQVVAKARHQLQAMSLQDLEQVESDCQLEEPDDACSNAVESAQARARFGQKPFDSFSSWGGFVVLGEVSRRS